MALFGGNKEADGMKGHDLPTGEEAMGDQDYFESMAGDGLNDFTAETVSTAYLSMVQPGSTHESVENPAGTWRNSASGENYTEETEVVVMAFKTVWTERDRNAPYSTVGRYNPKSIPVDVEYPKPGQRGFPKMTNPETGNKVEELFVYACMLKDRPEQGILYFSPTVGSMKTCKQWNAALRSQRIVTNRKDEKGNLISIIAPIHAFSWHITLGLVQNPNQPQNPNAKITKFINVRRGDLLVKAWHMENVAPQLAAAANVALLAAPETSGDSEE